MLNQVNVKEFLIKEIINNDIPYNSEKEIFEAFILFMEDNEWFQTTPQLFEINNKLTLYMYRTDIEKIRERVIFYFRNKNLPIKEKVKILNELLYDKYPLTFKDLKKYYKTMYISINEQYIITDFILWALTKDIRLYNNEEIELLVVKVCDNLTIRQGNILLSYIKWLKQNFSVNFTIEINLNKRITGRSSDAYDNDFYLNLVYFLFNPDHIEKNCMYDLAIENRNTCDVWLYLSLHFICALRNTDLFRIPHPRLKDNPETILMQISEYSFPDESAKLVANSIMWQMKNLPFTPSKTSAHSNVSFAKFHIPESAMIHFGTLFAIAESHFLLSGEKDKPLIRPYKDYESINKYLGEEIGELFLERNFSSRSATKSYMQGVEFLGDEILETESSLPHAKGYMLASLARSHKGSFGEFAKTTEIYLKDANFSGYSPEFIAKELFERGVCSFIPSILLKMISDGGYDRLSVRNQTELIQALGMTPNEIENFVISIENTFKKSQIAISNILKEEPYNRKDKILEILHNIACGDAASKTLDCMCLMTAIGHKCPFPDKMQCIGCKYEISTKSTVYLLTREFQRLLNLRDNTNHIHLKNKYTELLKDTIAPVLEEIFICAKEIYGDDVIKELEDIIKEIQNE